LLLVDHRPPGVHLLVRSISYVGFVGGVAVCTIGDLRTHDGSGSRLRVKQLWFGVFHCSSPFCSNFRMSKVPITEPAATDLYMQVPTYLQDLDRHRV
jgi:hypothetical protein